MPVLMSLGDLINMVESQSSTNALLPVQPSTSVGMQVFSSSCNNPVISELSPPVMQKLQVLVLAELIYTFTYIYIYVHIIIFFCLIRVY
jgi:hypothetical protein